MALSEQEILQVLDLFQKSNWQDLQLESGDIRLSISKTGGASAATRGTPATLTAAPAAAPVATAPVATPVAAPAPAAAAVDPRWEAVKAPLLGTFFAAPKPGAPPFVSVGQAVTAEDNIGIVEVMKLMNYVKAGIAGSVARIAATNGELVEFDEPLIYIDPENAS